MSDILHDRRVERAERGIIRSLDNYAAVFVLILLAIFATALIQPGSLWGLVPVVMTVGTMIIAMRASGVRPSRLLVAGSTGLMVTLGVAISLLLDEQGLAVSLYLTTMIALCVSAMAAIVDRLRKQPLVDAKTVMGALSFYLLLGLLYATVFALFQHVEGQFFAQIAPPARATSADFLYFSFVTLTTVGYGDLSAIGSMQRMVAISEALLGQLYLVTVVSMVVANMGRQRQERVEQRLKQKS